MNKNQAWSPSPIIQASKKPRIAIAVPYTGSFHTEWVESTYGPLRYQAVDWCDKIPILSKAPSLPVARDMLIKQSLELRADYTFFLDSDLIFESPKDPNLALRTLYQVMSDNSDSKIVSGLYRARKKDGFTYAMWAQAPEGVKGYVPISEWTGNWIEVQVTGLGCCLIDNTVFKTVPGPWFSWEQKEDISEDFFFMEKARKHGFVTRVFTDIKMSHIGTMKLMSDGSIVMSEM
jgi:hypothetical protein